MSLFSGIYKYVWPQMRKFQLAFWSIFFFYAIRTVLDHIIRPVYFKKIIDALSLPVDNHALLASNLFALVGTLVIIIFFTTLIARVCKFIIFSFEINVIRELRNFCFEKISRHSQTFFANTFSGSLVTKSRRFVGSFETMFDILVFQFWSTFVILAGVFVVLMQESTTIALFFLAWIVVYSLIIFFFIRKKVKYDLIEAASDSRVSGRLADVFGNILAVKIFSAGKSEIDSFRKVTDDAAKKSRTAWFLGGKIEVLQAVLALIVQSILLYVMVDLWLQDKITTGTVVLVQVYMVNIFEKLWDLGNALTKFMKAAADMQEMVDIISVVPDILDPKQPEALQMKEGNLVFENVSFSYKNGQEVLNAFNLDLKPGERIGLVGHSGAGKSTIISLILRFMDVTSGKILIDGQNIQNVTQDDLRSAISYVPQESVLFHRTIRENIAYGMPSATDEEVIAAAKRAHAHDFITKLPFGYDTYVGERGVKLSGGERQRIAVARAMIKNSPIFILDEATSSLDSVSEHYIQDAFTELMKGKTTIVIAHRLSTIQKMDRIIVLEDGAIKEEGTHKELLAKNGIYTNLWEHQTGGFLE